DSLTRLKNEAGLWEMPIRGNRHEDTRSVFDDLEAYLAKRGRRRPFVVHRIDRDTSGLVLFAKSAAAQQALKAQFKRREPERVYLAIVYGRPRPAAGTWRDTLAWDTRSLIQKETSPRDPRGKDAVSRYRVVEQFADAALLEVTLVT